MEIMFTSRHTKIFITLFLLAAFILPFINTQIVQAAVTFYSSSSATTGASTAQALSWTHTTGGTERILVVGVSVNTNTLVTSITYSGLPLTKITALENGNAVRVSLWYLLNPPTGSQTVTVNTSAAARFVAGAHSYTGVNQQNPFGTPATSRGNGTNASLTIQSSNNEIVVDVIARRGDLTTNPITAGAGQAISWNTRTNVNSSNNGVTGGGSSKTGASSMIMSWSWPATRAWAMAGISLKPAQAPDTTPPLRFNGLPSGTLPSSITQATLSLDTNESATCRYSTSAGVLYSSMLNTFSTTGGTSHSESITGLTDGSSYSFYVRCQDSAGNKNGDDFLISFSIDSPPPPPPDTDPPSTPQNFTATAILFSEIGLLWDASTDNVGVEGYKVFRDSSLIATIVSTENSYSDTGLSEQTTYTYQVLAFDAAGNESKKSAATSATTPAVPLTPDTEPPSTPTNVSAQVISSSQVDLSWDASTDNVGVAGYRVYRDGAHIASVDNIFYSDQGLDSATTYWYEISAVDDSLNESVWTAPVSATTLSPPPPPDTLPPSRFNGFPSGVLASDVESATLSLSTDEDAVCKYGNIPEISFDVMSNTFSTTGGTEHDTLITGLSADTNYLYYIRCYDELENTNADDFVVSFSIAPLVDAMPPTTPTNLSVISVSSTHISFSWTQSTDNVSVSGYKVFRNDELIATTLESKYSDFGLLELTDYTYQVSAYDAAGNESEKSATLIVTTPQSDIDAPIISNISISNVTSSSALISWQTNEPATSRAEYGFSTIYGAEVFDGNLITDHSFVLTGLSGGTTYHFRVRSSDGSGNSALSLDRTFETLFAPDITPPAAISNLNVGDLGPTFADIFWTAPGDDDITGQAALYDIRRLTNPINNSNWNSATKLTGEPTPALAGTTQHYLAIGLNPGTIYYFAVRSTDEAGNISALSNIISVTTPVIQVGGGGRYTADTTPPAEPSDFQAIPAAEQVLLRWKNPQDVDFVRVVVVKKIGSAPSSLQDGVVVYEGDKEEFIDAGLSGDDAFYYGISAYDRIPNYSQLYIINTKLQTGITQINLPKPEIPREENRELETIAELEPITVYVKFLRSLFLGVKGPDVSELQKILARNKIMYPQGIISGYFGNLTRQAVEKFQCAYGIVCFGNEKNTGYGRVGPKTASKLNELITRNPDSIPQVEFNLSFGARGNAVKILQEFLAKDPNVYPGGSVTGYFGNATEDAIKKFQCLHDIVCTGDEVTTGYGRVGPKTKAKIDELFFSTEQ